MVSRHLLLNSASRVLRCQGLAADEVTYSALVGAYARTVGLGQVGQV